MPRDGAPEGGTRSGERRSVLVELGEKVTDEVGRARAEGNAEAEAADLRLRLKEGLERERRLTELLREAEEALVEAPKSEHELRTQIDLYAAFNRAVERSLPWRMIQFLRRLVGREW